MIILYDTTTGACCHAACFSFPHDCKSDVVGQRIELKLDDASIRVILSALSKDDLSRPQINLRVPSLAGGDAHCMELLWQVGGDGFMASIDDMPAGYVSRDELVGALGKPIPNSYRTCAVCLSSELDVWRRGLLDTDKGEVVVYTANTGLATLGAHAYLTDAEASGLDAMYIELERGEPVSGALRVPRTQLRHVQEQIERESFAADSGDVELSAESAVNRLSELSKALEAIAPSKSPADTETPKTPSTLRLR